jgi:hypothetical protein
MWNMRTWRAANDGQRQPGRTLECSGSLALANGHAPRILRVGHLRRQEARDAKVPTNVTK